MTLVVAPAGSGKTTALRQFAARSESVAWCSADQLETSPDGCLAEIARLVGAAIGVELDGTSPASLAAGLDGWAGERVALVIDDLHGIASTMAESELGSLIDRQPPKLVIAAGTRSHPEFDLSRLLLDDELLEITADDLRFRTWEADRLFREHYDMILGPTDVAMLITRTEGWAAGLQLYNLAARDQPLDVRRRLIGELGSTRVGRDYLARNVLAGLPADLQSFLVDTSALPVLTGALCDKLTGRNDSASVLEHLEHNQLFTISVDLHGTYRYHEVLRAHLDAVLQQRLGVAGAIAHHRRVGELLEAEDRIDEALHAFSRAGDWSAVSRLVVHRMDHPSLIGRVAGDAWIELVPATIVENDSYLLLARARERTVNGRLGAAIRDYDRAIAGAAIDTVVRACEEERAALAGWSDPEAPAPCGWLGQLRRIAQGADLLDAADVSTLFNDLESAEPGELAAVLGHGLAMLISNQPDAAAEVLSMVIRHPLADSRSAAIAEFGLVVAEGLRSMQEDGEPWEPARIEQVASVVQRCGLGWVARMTRASLALTTQGDGCEAARAVHDDCERDSDPWGAALALLFEGAGRVLRGEDPSTTFEIAAKSFDQLGATAMIGLVDQLRGGASIQPVVLPPVTSTSMSLRCFVALEVDIDDTPIDLSTVRPRALSVLRLLALHAGRPVHREVLMEAFWPDVDPDAALRSLQVAVSSLRKVMPEQAPGIVRQGDTYQLELSSDADFDVRNFQRSLATAAAAWSRGDHRSALDEATRAIDAYRGDLLLDEGPADWVVAQRDSLRLDMVRACTIGGEAALKLGMPAEATRMSERGLAVDRYADALWRLQIESLEQANDKASAERVRRSWQEMMADLGVS
ncbi:MAG TPA: BTAD domain-containing putative transcriptional regulator [Ilumatobacteraceae bacterium]